MLTEVLYHLHGGGVLCPANLTQKLSVLEAQKRLMRDSIAERCRLLFALLLMNMEFIALDNRRATMFARKDCLVGQDQPQLVERVEMIHEFLPDLVFGQFGHRYVEVAQGMLR